MKRRRTRRRTWRRTRRRCGGLGGIGGIRSGNRIVPTWKATSGGGGIGSSISETQTAAAGRIVMEASTKIGTSMHEGSSKDGGAAEADKRAVGLMMTSAAAAIKDGVVAEAGERAVGSMVTSECARRRSSGKRWRLTWRSTRRRTRRHRRRQPHRGRMECDQRRRWPKRRQRRIQRHRQLYLLAAASFMV